MTEAERARTDWWVADVLVLTVATGVVEAVCLTHLGGVFAAFATGTLVLAGVHLGSGGGEARSMLPYAVAFSAFVVGGLAGGALVRGPGEARFRRYTTALVVEAALILLAAGLQSVAAGGRTADLATLALLAIAMSVQFSATKFLNLPDLRFAAATGLVHGLFHDVAARGAVPPRLPRRLLAAFSLPAGAALGVTVAAYDVALAILAAGLIVAGSAVASQRLSKRPL